MLLKAGLFSLALALVSTSASAEDIASTSLCGDGYVLAVAPSEISALSWQSRDKLSTTNNAQKTLPQIWDDLEVLASSEADIIVFGPGEGAHANKLPQKSIQLVWGEDFDTVAKNIKLIQDNAPTSKARTLDLWQSKREALQDRAAMRGENPKVLYLSRAGGSAGPGTFVDAAITEAGGINVITAPGWITPDPEIILSLDPDLIVTSFFEGGYESVQAAGVRNTLIRTFIAKRPRVDIPGALWPCAGPGLMNAAELIAEGLDGLE